MTTNTAAARPRAKGPRNSPTRGEGACSFDAPGAHYAPEGGKLAFEAILEEYGWEGHPALERMVRILRGETGPEEEVLAAPYACVEAIIGELSTSGFGDHQLYDALYARCAEC